MCLAPDHVTLLSKKLVDWLRYASITQGGVAPSGGFFTGPRSRQVILCFHIQHEAHSAVLTLCHTRLDLFLMYFCTFVFQPAPIAELDGTVSGDFFTVLCVGQGFTEDQWMNVYSFSMLHHWLLTYHSISNGNSTADTGMTLSLLQSAAFCLLMLEGLIPFCHSSELHNITFKVATSKAVINSPEPFPMTYCVFSSSPANRLQLSLSLSHSFSNGKTQTLVDFLCMPLRHTLIR